MREITFDTETTGLDVNQGHRVIEIGCIELIDRVKTGRVFHAYINPQRSIPKDSQQIHGITEEFLADKPRFHGIVVGFLEFMGDSTIVAHNAPFDMSFINYELKNAGRPSITMARVIDTLPMARKKFPGERASLDALCRRFNVDLSRREKHGALLDAELLAEVYIRLKGGGEQGSMQFSKPKNTVQETAPEEKPVRIARTYVLSEEEKEAHNALLRTLNNPVWESIKPLLPSSQDS